MRKPFTIFARTFLFSSSMLISVILIVFLLIYAFLPQFYMTYQTNQFQQQFQAKRSSLEQALNVNEELSVLQQVTTFEDGQISFILSNETGEILYEFNQMSHGINIVTSEQSLDNEELSMTTEYLQDKLFLEMTYFVSEGQRYLQVFIPMHSLIQARKVIMNLYPWAALLSILFALVMAWIFSRWIVVPIKTIRHATADMALLKPDVRIELRRKDEIGDLSQEINTLYQEFCLTIRRLEQEKKDHIDTENKKIRFLQTVSHEMKTPLASANALLEGILYDVAPYATEPQYYLEECRMYLAKTIALAKESLQLSEEFNEESKTYNLQQILQEVSSQYQIIFRSKQLSYEENIPDNIMITTKLAIFQRILSNLYSNAATHSDTGGMISLKVRNNCLAITNTCQPLSNEELENVFTPLYTKSKYPDSTGLGLTITHQLLNQLKLPYTFTPSEKDDGMMFCIFLDTIKKTNE
ncbi:hypothetical protein A5886_001466 [Enterococcus sp. 8G7_MSG3316]|uniref:histidine kinase n=1 Tax=Candidatus Enterococcus testudinis TaxID=1834191 RepID=A0A242A647_9ENTE|nr:HAMP domain-containing sensor histidine kinase [Enterococcus sp. 8G7_MSG3316]OTN76389.1 hypothetical protein A5886_001466 [Enterococcus sp. 8G7_MSG3316]